MLACYCKVPDRTKPESRVKKYYRWLINGRIGVELYFLPYVGALLKSLAHRPIVLAIDGSEVGRGCLTLMVSLIYRKRALPLAWIVVKGSKGHFPEEAHVELVNQVHALIPAHCIVIFGWRYVSRTAKNAQLYADGEWFSFKELGVERGERIGVHDVLFTHKAYGPVLATAVWDEEYKEPIHLT